MLSRRRCCCGGAVSCLNAGPCRIPDRNLDYAYTGVAPLSPTSGSGTLTFNGLVGFEAWTAPSFNDSFTLNASRPVGTFLPDITLGGISQATFTASSIYTSQCSPLTITYNVPNPSAAYTAGFRTITISDPGAPANPCACVFDHIHVTGCDGVGLSGTAIVIKDATGSTIASGTTDSSGNYSPGKTGGPYSVEISKSRFNTHTFTNIFLCNNAIQTFDMSGDVATGYVCLQGLGCADPVKTTLNATHSFFGATSATYLGGLWGFAWSYTTPGVDGCAVVVVTVGVTFSNVTTFGPIGPVGWNVCNPSQLACLPAGCPTDTGLDNCFDSASFVRSSLTCPPSFSWAGSATFTILDPSCQKKLYGLTGSQTFTLTLSE